MSLRPDCYNPAKGFDRRTGESDEFEDIEERSITMIIVTEKAAGEIKRVLAEQSMGEKVLRVAVAGGGCSGFQYRLGFDDAADAAKDHVTEQHGLKVAVDKKSDLYLDGTTVDFYDGLDRRGFTFNNPNVQKSCGCGSSFSV
ncbi:Iron-sulfur cluster insertion protein ErpA [Caulifigura coniformis]|uniref:Iron-sulfur cluster insertion protein ErpA n=2 Tax=Caulifigura coniformis TaxID=2527983 RepID=A0A517SFM9_9PLAN|nr:iron-sulfur cluster assembly accessory protein [Caulifigura coniformis]QDT54929.1 Iron-sulfur cluster insertion protein ErpA [Caulifigura coniformis]